jgi:hypothetical protein
MTEQAWKPEDAVQPAGATVNRTGAVISLVGGVLLIVGALMDWASVGSVGISSADGGDGEIVLFVGVVIVVLAGLDLILPGRWWWIGVGVGAGVALLSCVIDFFGVQNIQVEGELGTASVGAGLYVALIGAAVALVGALLRERSVR